MVSRLCVLLCFLAVCLSVGAQTDEPELVSANMPIYPALARQARIEGTVKVTFTLSANSGEPANVEVVSGHPVLKGAAVENVKTWHLRNPYAVDASTRPHSVIGWRSKVRLPLSLFGVWKS
jgi:TonB family protein